MVVVARLDDKNQGVRRVAVETVGRRAVLSNDVLNAVVARLADEDAYVRSAAIKAQGFRAGLPEKIFAALVATRRVSVTHQFAPCAYGLSFHRKS
jgi:HEAT repeat protein